MSREIPIIVDPGYDANFGNRRRGSEPAVNSASHMDEIPGENQFEGATKNFFDRRFERRHSEDPNTKSWKTTYYRSPNYDDERLKRRGSVPVNWNRPHGKRDRFEEIVERMMSANDDELLSGIMENDFGPFQVEEMREEHFGPGGTTTRHERVQRSPSAPSAPEAGVRVVHGTSPADSKPFGMKYKKDKNGCIEIPIHICKSDETNRNEEKHENIEQIPEKEGGDSEDGKIEKMSTTEPEKKEEAVQTEDDDFQVTITVDSTTETDPGKSEGENNINEVGASKSENEKIQENEVANEKDHLSGETLHEDEAKISHIKKIENELKQTHDKVAVFKATESKDNNKEYLLLEELLMKALMSLDAVEANGSTMVREARKSVVRRVQEDLKELEKKRFPLDQK